MADRAKSAPRPRDLEGVRANDNTVDFPGAARGAMPVDPRSTVPLGVDDMAAGRITPGAAIEAQRAHLAAEARDMDMARQQGDGTIEPRRFDRRFPVLVVLIGVAVVVAALVLF